MRTLFKPRSMARVLMPILLAFIVLFQDHRSMAQSQAATQATVVTNFAPPYQVPLANLTSQQLRVIITPLNGYIDDGKVSIIIQGSNGIRIQNNFLTDNFYLQVTDVLSYQLTDFDLQEIFNRNNFSFTGITADEAFDTGLPPWQL